MRKAACSTRSRTAGLTLAVPFITRETVAGDTLASGGRTSSRSRLRSQIPAAHGLIVVASPALLAEHGVPGLRRFGRRFGHGSLAAPERLQLLADGLEELRPLEVGRLPAVGGSL